MRKKIILITLIFISITVKSQTLEEYSRYWTSFTKTLNIEFNTTRKFKLEASSKLISTDKIAWGGLWAGVKNKDGKYGFRDNMKDRPIKSDSWNTYTIEGVMDSNSKSLEIGGFCVYNGKFYFDDFKLYIENDKGILEYMPLPNEGFEKKVTEGNIPEWSPDLVKDKYVKIKGFEISSTDDKIEGEYALLIEGKGIIYKEPGQIIPVDGASLQIGTLISMLEDLRERVKKQVRNMSQYELDYLHDENANRIGALIMHLAAAEVYYQVFTFENRGFNEEEKAKWQVALDLDEGGRNEIYGQSAQYYLDIYNEVREKTIEELRKRDDEWLAEVQVKYKMNNHYCWFHVMEHQSSHLGQILFLKKRIPPEPELEFKEKNKY